MKILFICNFGQNRSRTAAEIFGDKHNTRYKGIISNRVSEEDVSWADKVFVMEEQQKRYVENNFSKELGDKVIVNLNIQNVYSFNDLELVERIKKKINL